MSGNSSGCFFATGKLRVADRIDWFARYTRVRVRVRESGAPPVRTRLDRIHSRFFPPPFRLKPRAKRARVAHGFINGRVAFRGFKCIFQFTQRGRARFFSLASAWKQIDVENDWSTVDAITSGSKRRLTARNLTPNVLAASRGHDRSIRFLCYSSRTRKIVIIWYIRRWNDFNTVFRYTFVYTATTR